MISDVTNHHCVVRERTRTAMSKNQQELHYPEPVREPALSRTLFIATIALYFTDTLLACLVVLVKLNHGFNLVIHAYVTVTVNLLLPHYCS